MPVAEDTTQAQTEAEETMSEFPSSPAWLIHRIEVALNMHIYPSHYQICEGCDGVLYSETIKPGTICPECHGYRFTASIDRVRSVADAIVRDPEPRTYKGLEFCKRK